MVKSKRKKYSSIKAKTIYIVSFILVILIYLFLFSSMSNTGNKKYIFIDSDDNIDSVYAKIEPISTKHAMFTFKVLAYITSYKNRIREGKYEISSRGAILTFRNFFGGRQATISVTIRSVRTLKDLANVLSNKLSFSRDKFLRTITSKDVCAKYGYTPKTIIAMFIPNTYEFYWNTSITKFLDRMKKENEEFWKDGRKDRAKEIGFTPTEIIILASIVDEETDDESEMPAIAGMYINRLHAKMPLQADPTVKYALGKFDAHRIYHNWLSYDSPYNTYKYRGLPPGPIRIPSVSAIEAVLNYEHHDYMYMCAKEDFSGTHNFAKNYEEHKVNAKNYAKALTEHGIK